MNEQQPLFRVVSAEEFAKSPAPSKRKALKTEPRTLTTWYDLQHSMGFCTVPDHDDVYRSLNPEKQAYRQKYPTRMIIRIGEYDVCRDCYLVEADKV
jgi:hypothetical protein